MKGWIKTHWNENGQRGTVWSRRFGRVTITVSSPQGRAWVWSLDGRDFFELCGPEYSVDYALAAAQREFSAAIKESLKELGEPLRVRVDGEWVGETYQTKLNPEQLAKQVINGDYTALFKTIMDGCVRELKSGKADPDDWHKIGVRELLAMHLRQQENKEKQA